MVRKPHGCDHVGIRAVGDVIRIMASDCNQAGKETGESQAREAGVRVAEVVELHTHAVHDAEVKAAQLAVLVAPVAVVEHAAGGQRGADDF